MPASQRRPEANVRVGVWGRVMSDLVYVLLSVAVFAVLALVVRGVERL